MKHYYFYNNVDTRGNHEVHTSDCPYLPSAGNRTRIGAFYNCQDAITNAKSTYPSKSFDGCHHCCPPCHKG